MIDIAIEVVFLGAMALFWYMAKNSTLRVFRILFVLGGFLFLYAAFTTAATFTTAYTVPASPVDPSYNQSNIASLTNVMYTFANVTVIFAIFYLMIELAIYLYMVWQLLAKHNTTKDAFMLQDKQGD